jgi:hypothetical protein
MKNRPLLPSLGSALGQRSRLGLILLALLMVPVFFVSKSVFTALAQKDTKNKVIKKMDFPNSAGREPIEILEITSNGKAVHFEESFIDDYWLKDLTIKFRNVSDKTITYLNLNLRFPETASAGEPSGFPATYTLHYGLSRTQEKAGVSGAKSLKPGETDSVSLPTPSYAQLKQLVGTRRELSDLTTAYLTVITVYFDDGMQWSAGDLFRPDPTTPGRYVLAKDTE